MPASSPLPPLPTPTPLPPLPFPTSPPPSHVFLQHSDAALLSYFLLVLEGRLVVRKADMGQDGTDRRFVCVTKQTRQTGMKRQAALTVTAAPMHDCLLTVWDFLK